MKPSDYINFRREVMPSEHVNVYLGMEYFMSTYFEMNFSDSSEHPIHPIELKKININVWFSWS